ncbi:carboxypeptidase-like regulatory domain-containing protein [Gaetbulibacter saemankumensis]|uniref:carboxypeptidase-like regulatory domain-containing protein n=1 Tax=Gaetbulibacter saemankumensis TaxID=311208 RepID=UPI000423F0BF|nr:carboxypeptidase-like regulatory domain-containing protein [Gaetbulibacter saemankumensis]
MKNILLIVFCITNFISYSQNYRRIDVEGQIVVESNDVSGITIFNVSSNMGTISDNDGKFKIAVRLNDIIEVSALQFQNIRFEVNESIVASRQMKIFLIEEINKLDEIVLRSKNLTGNLEVDLAANQQFKPKLDALYFGLKNKDQYEFTDDNQSDAQNILMNRQEMKYGLNIANVVGQVLLPLFRTKAPKNDDVGIPEVPVEAVKYYFGSEFLQDNFNIPEHRVEDFIEFVEGDNFDYSLLNHGREMEFLEYLHQKSLEFLGK